MKKGFLVFLVLTLAFSLVLVACGQEATSDKDQILIFARGGDSVSLDFASVTDGESSRVTKQIFETLIEFEADSFEVGPGLAHDWDISEDGMSFTFYLREGVKFHDGTDFNAEAVKFNFERWSDKSHPYHFADEGFSYTVYGSLFGGFKGDEGHIIEDIIVHDEHTIEFVLNQPSAAFIQNLGANYFAIASPQSFEDYGADITENPVGTGPFKFVEWRKNDSITLVRNEDYWKEGYPKLDEVIFRVIPDNSARLNALRSGDIDLMDGLSPDDVASVEGDSNLQLFERAPNNVGYLGFNTEKPPFDDPLVRRALNHAVDKEALLVSVYNNLAVTAKNPVPPGYLGYNDALEEYTYDPELAKELLAEAGYADGFEFDLWTMPVARPYMPDPEEAAVALQANFRAIGLTANIVTKEWATYLEETQEGKQDVYMLGWSGVNGDPDYFVYNLLSTDAIPGGNRSFYSNSQVDELLLKAQKIIDVDEREAVYHEALALIHEDAPWIPLVHNTPVLAGGSHVHNYVPHPSTSEALTYVEIR